MISENTKSIHRLRLKSKGTLFSNFTKAKFDFTKYEAYVLPSFKSKGMMFSDSPRKNLTSPNTKSTHCLYLRVCLHKITKSMRCLRLIKNKKLCFAFAKKKKQKEGTSFISLNKSYYIKCLHKYTHKNTLLCQQIYISNIFWSNNSCCFINQIFNNSI
jgi:hypothetical protein